MFTFRTMSRRFLIVSLALFTMSQASGQYLGRQRPVERDPAEVARIMGPIEPSEPSRDLNIVWVWGLDKYHPKQTHEYAWVMDRYVYDLLPNVPRVTVTPSYYFPTQENGKKPTSSCSICGPKRMGAASSRAAPSMNWTGAAFGITKLSMPIRNAAAD